jgi:hypothetical protein
MHESQTRLRTFHNAIIELMSEVSMTMNEAQRICHDLQSISGSPKKSTRNASQKKPGPKSKLHLNRYDPAMPERFSCLVDRHEWLIQLIAEGEREHGRLSVVRILKETETSPPHAVRGANYTFEAVQRIANNLLQVGWHHGVLLPINWPGFFASPAERISDENCWIEQVPPQGIRPLLYPDTSVIGDFHDSIRLEHDRAQRILADRLEEIGKAQSIVESNNTIWSHGNGTYSINKREQFKVTIEADAILQLFLNRQQPLETKEISSRITISNVSRTINWINEFENGLFAQAIRSPNRRGGGGYFIRISRLSE